jgi:hypothetical protein
MPPCMQTPSRAAQRTPRLRPPHHGSVEPTRPDARSAPPLCIARQGGCGVGRSFFHVTACDQQVGGGFSTDYGVGLTHRRGGVCIATRSRKLHAPAELCFGPSCLPSFDRRSSDGQSNPFLIP